MNDVNSVAMAALDQIQRLEARLAEVEKERDFAVTGLTIVERRRDELKARLAMAEDAIESAGRCLVMSNNGAREALNILRGYKQTADSAAAIPCPHPDVAIVGVAGDMYCTCCGDPMPAKTVDGAP